MKKMLQPRKKLATFATLLCLMSMMPLTALAEVINTVTSSETITKTSTVYVGEVVVDGVTQIKYLYSGDISIYSYVIQNILDGMNGMADGDYAALLEEHEFDYGSQTTGFAICSNPDLVATMDGNWSSAQYVGTLYYPDKTVTSEINSNLYDIDEGFKAVLDSKTQYRIENIDTPADAEKCIVTQIDSNSNSSVYYTVEDGEIIKHVDTHVVFLSEATTVIYTKVELATASTSTLLGDVDGDGTVSVTDVAMIVNHILGVNDDNFIAANTDVDGDGEIGINDVMGAVSIILGDNGNGNGGGIGDTSQAYLTCPDDHHPHIIDLGLPSGTKWACCNVCASAPEEYGGYYAWGEMDEKSVYNDVTYQYCTGEDRNGDGWYDDWRQSPYGSIWYIYGQWQNLGNKTLITSDIGIQYYLYDIAGTQYDVAHVKWGGSWVMPSEEQILELSDNCFYSGATNMNGVEGGIFTDNNGGAIYLPFAGVKCCSGLFMSGEKLNGCGCYWSSNLDLSRGYGDSDVATRMGIGVDDWIDPGSWTDRDDDIIPWNNKKQITRSWGLPVRPIWVP